MLSNPEKAGFRVWTLEGVAQEGWVACHAVKSREGRV
jgi:hypothetical protein